MTASESFAAVGMTIVERDGDTIRAEIETRIDIVTVIADLVRIGDRLVIDGIHVEGQGLTLTRIREVAQVFGRVEDVVQVILQGGVRTSGAHPGSSPTPIRVKVTQ